MIRYFVVIKQNGSCECITGETPEDVQKELQNSDKVVCHNLPGVSSEKRVYSLAQVEDAYWDHMKIYFDGDDSVSDQLEYQRVEKELCALLKRIPFAREALKDIKLRAGVTCIGSQQFLRAAYIDGSVNVLVIKITDVSEQFNGPVYEVKVPITCIDTSRIEQLAEAVASNLTDILYNCKSTCFGEVKQRYLNFLEIFTG